LARLILLDADYFVFMGFCADFNFGNITMTAAGSYSYVLNVNMTGDLLATNDNATFTRTIVATQATPYAVDFDAAAGSLAPRPRDYAAAMSRFSDDNLNSPSRQRGPTQQERLEHTHSTTHL
jgi:hypothetical protein